MNEDKKPGMMVGSERSSGSSSPQSTSRDMLTRAVDLANHAPVALQRTTLVLAGQ